MALFLQTGSPNLDFPGGLHDRIHFFKGSFHEKFSMQFSYRHSQLGFVEEIVNGRKMKCGIAMKNSRRSSLGVGLVRNPRYGFCMSAAYDDHEEFQQEPTPVTEEKPLRQYAWKNAKTPRICVLGGGCGGLYAALTLESLTWSGDKKPQVLLVDQSDRFVFKPMMYELLSKEVDLWEVAPRFEDLFSGTTIEYEKGRVKSVSPCDGPGRSSEALAESIGGTVLLESGLQIEYDWLLLALGGESKRDFVPGALEYALSFSSLKDVQEVDMRLKDLERRKFDAESSIGVAVVGAGYAGVELAATVAERLGERGKVQVVGVAPDICPSAPDGNREAAYKVLSSRSVELILGFLASNIRKSLPGEDGEYSIELMSANKPSRRSRLPAVTLSADLVLWAVGSNPSLPEDILNNGMRTFPLNGRGQIEVEDTLRVKGHPRIFAIGDSAFFKDNSGKPLPPTAQVAFQESDYVGWNIWAAINERPLLPFRYQNLGEMMTLGKNDAAVTLSLLNGLTLEGPVGHSVRKVGYLYRLPTNEHRLKVGLSWLTKSAIDTVASVQDALTRLASNSG